MLGRGSFEVFELLYILDTREPTLFIAYASRIVKQQAINGCREKLRYIGSSRQAERRI
jgi:hypothetical protein